MPDATVHVHVPYPVLDEALPFLIDRRLNVELFFSADTLDRLVPELLASTAARLDAEGVKRTIHAPFMDLNPGSYEPLLQEITRRRFHQVMDAAALLRPQVVVFHPGYDKWRYGETRDRWLAESIPLWQEMVERGEECDCLITVENIFEEEPSTLFDLIRCVDSPRLRHCFDVGHWNMFTKVSMEEWFSVLGPYIAEAHIHDNHGQKDEHAPLGEGNIDTRLFFSLLERYAPDAVRTIEAHSREKLERALKSLREITREMGLRSNSGSR
jgi:sugar phosphate isomerase/epimerase